jgi:hypothetical protein
VAFDVGDDGMVKLNPLVDYERAIVAGTGCAFRLVLSRREDAPGTGSMIVQTVMSVEQAKELVQDLQKMIDRILSTKLQRPN